MRLLRTINSYCYPIYGKGHICVIEVQKGVEAIYIKAGKGYLVELISRLEFCVDGRLLICCDTFFYRDLMAFKTKMLINQTTFELPIFDFEHHFAIQVTGQSEGTLIVYREGIV